MALATVALSMPASSDELLVGSSVSAASRRSGLPAAGGGRPGLRGLPSEVKIWPLTIVAW